MDLNHPEPEGGREGEVASCVPRSRRRRRLSLAPSLSRPRRSCSEIAALSAIPNGGVVSCWLSLSLSRRCCRRRCNRPRRTQSSTPLLSRHPDVMASPPLSLLRLQLCHANAGGNIAASASPARPPPPRNGRMDRLRRPAREKAASDTRGAHCSCFLAERGRAAICWAASGGSRKESFRKCLF